MALFVLLSGSTRTRIVAADFFADTPDLLNSGSRRAFVRVRQRQRVDRNRLFGYAETKLRVLGSRLFCAPLAFFLNLLLRLLYFLLRLNPHIHQHAHDIGAYTIE